MTIKNSTLWVAPQLILFGTLHRLLPPVARINFRVVVIAIVILSLQTLPETTHAAQELSSQQVEQSLKEAFNAAKLNPTDSSLWYSVIEKSTFVAPESTQPAIGIEACNRLIELGHKPYFALGLNHHQLKHWSEALEAFAKCRLELRKAGDFKDKTLGEADVNFLYIFLTELLVKSGADDIALEMIRERSSPRDQLKLIQHNMSMMIETESWDTIVAAARIVLDKAPADSPVAKQLLFNTAFAQAYSGQTEAFKKTAQAAQAIKIDNEGLTAQCNNLPMLLDAKAKQVATSSTPYRWLTDEELGLKIKKLRDSQPRDQTALQNCYLENIRRIRNSGMAERIKNDSALKVANEALRQLPESTILATQKLELLYVTDQYDEIKTLLTAPRASAYKNVSSAWPNIAEAKRLMQSEDKASRSEAVKLAKQAFEGNPSNAIFMAALLDAYAAADEFEPLFALARKGIQIDCWQAAATIADYYQFSGSHIDSFMLSSIARKIPTANQPLFAWKRAESLHALGMDEIAMKLYSDSFDGGFSANGVRQTAIKVCLDNHKYDDALRYCQQEIDLTEKKTTDSKKQAALLPTYLLLAQCHLARGEIRAVEDTILKIEKANEISQTQTDTLNKLKRQLAAATKDKAALMAISHGKAGLLSGQMSAAAKNVIDLKLLQRQIDHINNQHPWLSRKTWAGHHYDQKWQSQKRTIRIPTSGDKASTVSVVLNRSTNGELLSVDIVSPNNTISTANCIARDSSIIKPAVDFFQKLAALDFKGSRTVGANFGNDGVFIPLEKFKEIFQSLGPVLQEIASIDVKEAVIADLLETDGEPEASVFMWANMKDGSLLPLQCRFDLLGDVPRFASFNMGNSIEADFHSTDQENAKRFITAFGSGKSEQIVSLMPESKRHLIEDLPLFAVFQTEVLANAGQPKGIKADSFTGKTKVRNSDVSSNASMTIEFANNEAQLELGHYYDELHFFDVNFSNDLPWKGSDRVKEILTVSAKRDLRNYIAESAKATKEMLVNYGGFSKLTSERLAEEKQQFASWMGDLQELKIMSAEFNEGRWEFFLRVIGSEGQGRAKIFYSINGFDIELDSFAVKPESYFTPQPKPAE